MFIKNTKGDIDPIKILFIIFVYTTSIMTLLLVFTELSSIHIEEKKMNSQLLTHKIFFDKCLGDEYGKINYEKFSQDKLDTCYSNYVEDKKLLVELTLIEEDNKSIYINQKENEFNHQKKFCDLAKNLYCQEISYPITLNKDNTRSLALLEVNIIALS